MTRRLRSARALIAAAAALCAGVAGAAAAAVTLRRGWFRVAVAGESMTPALQPGEFLVVRRGGPAHGERAAGQVVAARAPGGRLVLKRIIAVPGESLRVGTAVQVNGRVLVEPYAHGLTPPHQFRGLNRLGTAEYFLLGDRRDASTDSRDFGPVRRAAIEGVAVLRYWPPRRAGRLRTPPRELTGPERSPTPVPTGITGASPALTRAARTSGGNGNGHTADGSSGDGEESGEP